MPFEIRKVSKRGFKVMIKGSKPARYFSRKKLTYKRALAQMRALYASKIDGRRRSN